MKILDIASLEKNFLDKVFDLTATISNDWPNVEQIGAVSYTHLTLPTMDSV